MINSHALYITTILDILIPNTVEIILTYLFLFSLALLFGFRMLYIGSNKNSTTQGKQSCQQA